MILQSYYKWRVGLLLLGAPLLSAPAAVAQTYFNHRFPANASGDGSGLGSVLVTADSGYLVTGVQYTGPASSPVRLVLTSLDARGQARWRKLFTKPGYDLYPAFGSGILPVPGGCVVVGNSLNHTGIGAPYHGWLSRFAATGDTIWTRFYQVGQYASFNGGCRTRDGGYALVGIARTSRTEVLLLRTDSLGTVLWQHTYRWSAVSTGHSVTELPDGGFVLGGVTSDLGYLRQGTYVVRTDSVGNQLWHERFGHPTFNNGIGTVCTTRDGNIGLVAARGESNLIGAEMYQRCVYKLTPTGTVLWQRAIGPVTYSASSIKLLELPDGWLVGAGQEEGPVTAPVAPRGVIFQLCPAGDSLWYRTYQLLTGPESHNYVRGLAATPDGGFVAAGFVFASPPDTGTNDGWVFKVDSAGYAQPGGLAPDLTTCTPLGTAEPAATAEPVGLAVWPNPATHGVLVRVPGGGDVVLLDALGRVVRTGAWAAGGPPVRWSVVDLPPGLYVVRAGARSQRLVVAPEGRQ